MPLGVAGGVWRPVWGGVGIATGVNGMTTATVGQCIDCKRPAVDGRRRCPACLASQIKHSQARRDARGSAGICIECQSPALAGHQRCQQHTDALQRRDRNRVVRNRAAGICIQAGCRARTGGAARCRPCADQQLLVKRLATARRAAERAAAAARSERAVAENARRKAMAKALGQYPEWLRDAMAAAEVCLAGCGSDVGRGGPFCAGCMPKA